MQPFNMDNLRELIIPGLWIAIGLSSGVISEKIVLRKLSKAARKTAWEGDEIILASLKHSFFIFFSLVGFILAARSFPGAPTHFAIIEKIVTVVLIFLGTFVLARIASGLAKMYSQRVSSGFLATSIFANVAKSLIFIIGFLTILQYLNISIAPILTALGVGGLAVALALKDTLANLFAGLQIIASKQIKPGDYIKLSSGEEGFVMDITWRCTNIRALANTITIVPNSLLAQAIVTNFDLPESELSVPVQVGVSYDSDLEKVERVTREEAKMVMKEVAGAVCEFEPYIRYQTFGDSSINFSVILRGSRFVDQFLIKHEFIKRLRRRYEQEGIQIPFPIRTIQMDQNVLDRWKETHP
ncbi:MAG TPA: mechanosensitive ion channel family protein [Syntrophales bacterium]|nr:mechanosensitive ion channel family protein [Syntrophales bacterium]